MRLIAASVVVAMLAVGTLQAGTSARQSELKADLAYQAWSFAQGQMFCLAYFYLDICGGEYESDFEPYNVTIETQVDMTLQDYTPVASFGASSVQQFVTPVDPPDVGGAVASSVVSAIGGAGFHYGYQIGSAVAYSAGGAAFSMSGSYAVGAATISLMPIVGAMGLGIVAGY